MASLTDLFNPTFLMFLGILLLSIALLVLYFESKFREQNHKISSMLSVVSALAEEMNMVKYNLSTTLLSGGSAPQFFRNVDNNININSNLIPVSDDDSESEDDDSESESDSDDESETDSDDESESNNLEKMTIDMNDNSNIKILKLNILNEFEDKLEEEEDLEEELELELEEEEELEELEELDDNISDSESLSEIVTIRTQEIKIIKENETLGSYHSDFKSINISGLDLEESTEIEVENFEQGKKVELEEGKKVEEVEAEGEENKEYYTNNGTIDYKKLSLNKLRSVVLEKGLVKDSSRLKKPELFKLLEI